MYVSGPFYITINRPLIENIRIFVVLCAIPWFGGPVYHYAFAWKSKETDLLITCFSVRKTTSRVKSPSGDKYFHNRVSPDLWCAERMLQVKADVPVLDR